MARCPYCDAEYTPGEIYCKNCNEDLSALDQQAVSAPPELPEPPSVFTPSPPPTALPPLPPVDPADRDTPSALPEVPVVPQVPLAQSGTKAPVTHTPTVERGEPRDRAAAAAPRPVGPVCPSCGMTNERDSRFCDGCGTPLSGS